MNYNPYNNSHFLLLLDYLLAVRNWANEDRTSVLYMCAAFFHHGNVL